MPLCYNQNKKQFNLAVYISKINDEIDSQRYGIYFCPLCPRSFPYQFYLQVHLAFHVHMGEIFPCFKCPRIFLTYMSYLQHVALCAQSNNIKEIKITSIDLESVYSRISPVTYEHFYCPVCLSPFFYLR